MGLRLGSFGEMSRRQALVVTWDIHAKFVAVRPKYSIFLHTPILVSPVFFGDSGELSGYCPGIQNPISRYAFGLSANLSPSSRCNRW
jgi:hypothetical protein